MKCEKCQQQEATVHLTQMVNGKVCTLRLCQTCALDAGLDPNGPMDLQKLFKGTARLYEELHQVIPPGLAEIADQILERFAEQQEEGISEGADERLPAKCPACGRTLAEIRETKRLGCETCYGVFGRLLVQLLRKMGAEQFHVGATPRNGPQQVIRLARMKTLQHELAEAVAREDYETAARLRDELQQLEPE